MYQSWTPAQCRYPPGPARPSVRLRLNTAHLKENKDKSLVLLYKIRNV